MRTNITVSWWRSGWSLDRMGTTHLRYKAASTWLILHLFLQEDVQFRLDWGNTDYTPPILHLWRSFLRIWVFPPISRLRPFIPISQSSRASSETLSWHLIHMASSFFWITTWSRGGGGVVAFGMDIPVMLMSDSRFCLPKYPAALIRGVGKGQDRSHQKWGGPGSRGSVYLHGRVLISERWTQD